MQREEVGQRSPDAQAPARGQPNAASEAGDRYPVNSIVGAADTGEQRHDNSGTIAFDFATNPRLTIASATE